ncbi:MAG: right-handed parallel beta-helix repeat-containing protein [Candidatus Gracilibacteria bacterium]|nr:right-handed parallel beta-helix repeat-containing protein [Candidatus Gracilibacteria bacterium]
MLKKIILSFILSIILFGINSTNATDVSGTISTDTTWTLANSPYVITSNLTLNSGYTLTINPGVIVKVKSGLAITIRGNLQSLGTSTENVVFTSYKDDIGGDTNGDGNVTTPGIDWIAIHIYGAGSTNSILDYTQVKHAGGHIYPYLYTGIYIKDSSPTVRNSLITLNYHGIRIRGNSSPTIFNNIIEDNSQNGLYINVSGGTPDIQNNTIQNICMRLIIQ